MSTLSPEQWRVVGRLIDLCGEPARLLDMLKTQDVSPEAVCDLAERGLIVARLNGEEIELTPGLIKTYRKRITLHLSKTGELHVWNDPHRVLRSIGRARHGLSLSYVLGMILFDDLAGLARAGLVYALTEDDTVNLGDARQRWAGSERLVLPGGGELRTRDVIVRTTKAGQLYCERH